MNKVEPKPKAQGASGAKRPLFDFRPKVLDGPSINVCWTQDARALPAQEPVVVLSQADYKHLCVLAGISP